MSELFRNNVYTFKLAFESYYNFTKIKQLLSLKLAEVILKPQPMKMRTQILHGNAYGSVKRQLQYIIWHSVPMVHYLLRVVKMIAW